MTLDEFLELEKNAQNGLLIKMADAALVFVKPYPEAYEPAKDSVQRIQKYMQYKSVPAVEVGIHLNHPDENQDLSALFDFVEDDPAAIDALDIITFATGSVALDAYKTQGIKAIPEPVMLATPETAFGAIDAYTRCLFPMVPKLEDLLGANESVRVETQDE